MNVKIKNIEAVNILKWINSEDCILNKKEFELPVKIMWSINYNLTKLLDIQKVYSDTLNKVNQKYSTEEKSYELEKKLENDTLTKVRKVKPEYIKDYSIEQNELRLFETEIDIKMIKLSDLIDNGMEKCSFTDILMLSFMIDG